MKKPLLSGFFFLVLLILESCYYGGGPRGYFYTVSLKPYNIFSDLKRGDSIFLTLGDTIPFRYRKNMLGYEKGQLLVKRNKYNKIEFYELGEWTDHRKDGLIQKAFFERRNGIVMHKQWYRINDVDYVLSDSRRFIRNDSLIQVLEWYHGNGKIHSQLTYLIKRGYKKRQLDAEKEIEIGKGKYFSEDGQPTGKNPYKVFKTPTPQGQ